MTGEIIILSHFSTGLLFYVIPANLITNVKLNFILIILDYFYNDHSESVVLKDVKIAGLVRSRCGCGIKVQFGEYLRSFSRNLRT